MQFGGFPFGAVSQHSAMDDLWVLGGVFLQHFVSIYDFDKKRLGFCEPKAMAPSLGSAPEMSGLSAISAPTSPAASAHQGFGQVLCGILVASFALLGIRFVRSKGSPNRQAVLADVSPLSSSSTANAVLALSSVE